MIDPYNLTYDELDNLDYSKLTQDEIKLFRQFVQHSKSKEQSIKLTINSIYGAFGNNFFHFYNPNIAESITLQGQEAIKYVEKMIEEYFSDYFHLDTELHEKLGVSKDYTVPKMKNKIYKYGDTDSGYLSFEEPMYAVKWDGSEMDFVLALNEHRLSELIKKFLLKFADDRNTKNFLEFELESIAQSSIFVAKKKYVQNIVWLDGKVFDSLEFIKATGIELVQSSTPQFARERITSLLNFIFEKKKLKIEDMGDIVNEVKKIKDEFKITNVEKLSVSFNINDYDKHVINDVTAIEVKKGCPIHVRAAAHFNYLVNKNKLKNKYELIKSGDRINFYYVDSMDPITNVFGFRAGEFPIEFAPAIDVETQFNNIIINPINRIIRAAGLMPINPVLSYYKNTLF